MNTGKKVILLIAVFAAIIGYLLWAPEAKADEHSGSPYDILQVSFGERNIKLGASNVEDDSGLGLFRIGIHAFKYLSLSYDAEITSFDGEANTDSHLIVRIPFEMKRFHLHIGGGIMASDNYGAQADSQGALNLGFRWMPTPQIFVDGDVYEYEENDGRKFATALAITDPVGMHSLVLEYQRYDFSEINEIENLVFGYRLYH